MSSRAGKGSDADVREAMWRMYSDHIAQCRHHEGQRSAVLSVTITISAALIGIATFDKSIAGIADAAIFAALASFGIFGAGFSLKHYERYRFHMQRARGFREVWDDLLPGTPLAAVHAAADAEHDREFPHLRRMRLHYWWLGLNLAMSLLGVILFAVAMWNPIRAAG